MARDSEKAQLSGWKFVGERLFLVWIVLSSVMFWLIMARFMVDEKRLQEVEASCSPR